MTRWGSKFYEAKTYTIAEAAEATGLSEAAISAPLRTRTRGNYLHRGKGRDDLG
jgi:hypothetical protein